VDSNYYPGHDGLIKFTVDSAFGLQLLSKNSGFMILFFEDNRRAPFLYTQINLLTRRGSPFYISQYSFMGQQPNPNALLQAFELQQKTGYDIREGSAQLCRSAQDWTGYPLSNGDMNYEPTGTPGGVMEVIHWGSRDVPIPTPGLKILSTARVDGIPALKGTLTRTTCITCQACGLSHTKQKANQPRRNAPPQYIAATNSATEFPFSCHSCKVSFLSKEAVVTHTRGVPIQDHNRLPHHPNGRKRSQQQRSRKREISHPRLIHEGRDLQTSLDELRRPEAQRRCEEGHHGA
jgi:hypothetical protein